MNRDRATVYTVLVYLLIHMCMSAWLHWVSHYKSTDIIAFDIYFTKILKASASIMQFLL